jgi:hypothetical protein
MSNTQDPVTVPGSRGGTKITHPAFGQISVHRAQTMGGPGSGAVLYGSDFVHNNVMTIRIHRSELHRDLSRDWPFARETIAEVTLSEAQRATFVSSPNSGDGVQCTLEFTEKDGQIPGLPRPEDRLGQAKGEVAETLGDAIKIIDGLIAEVAEKGRASDLKGRLASARQELVANIPFVAEQFDRHMEKTVEKAKVEVHGYITNTLQRAGLEALAGPDSGPLRLEGPEEAK